MLRDVVEPERLVTADDVAHGRRREMRRHDQVAIVGVALQILAPGLARLLGIAARTIYRKLEDKTGGEGDED